MGTHAHRFMNSCTDASPENGTAAYVKGFVNASNASSIIVLDANMSRLDVNEYIKIHNTPNV